MELDVEAYIAYMKDVKKASVNTTMSYRADLTKFMLYLKSQSIDSYDRLNETFINSYILHLEKTGMTPATVSRNIAVIKSFVLYLMKQGKMKEDPTERIKPPKVEKKVPKTLTVQEMERLLSKPDKTTKKGLRDSAMLELLYATGIRVTELIHLKVSDVYLKNGFICCTSEDTAKSRFVPFGNCAKQVLTQYLETGRTELLKGVETDILFPNLNGRPMTRQGFWKLIKIYASLAQIEVSITPQILRHTFAMHLVNNGADLRSLQELLGYADIASTQMYTMVRHEKVRDVYTHTHPRA